MKRYIKSDININAIKEYESYLKRIFKENPECSFRRIEPTSSGLVKEYVVSRKLYGNNIEMYVREYDSDTNTSFGGGVTLVSGYWDVAQYMLNHDWTIQKTQREEEYETGNRSYKR